MRNTLRQRFTLALGDTVVLYTDGITETRDAIRRIPQC